MENCHAVRLHVILETKELFRENLGAILSRLKVAVTIYFLVFGLGLTIVTLFLVQPSEYSGTQIRQLMPAISAMLAITLVLPLSFWLATRKATNDPRAKPGYDLTIADSGYSSAGSTGRV